MRIAECKFHMHVPSRLGSDYGWPDLRQRTKEFAKRIVRLCRALPRTREASLIGHQVFRSGTSVGANYRAACRARSRADFVAKMGIVLEEADETAYWPELLVETDIVAKPKLVQETRELVAIFVASLNTARANRTHSKT